MSLLLRAAERVPLSTIQEEAVRPVPTNLKKDVASKVARESIPSREIKNQEIQFRATLIQSLLILHEEAKKVMEVQLDAIKSWPGEGFFAKRQELQAYINWHKSSIDKLKQN